MQDLKLHTRRIGKRRGDRLSKDVEHVERVTLAVVVVLRRGEGGGGGCARAGGAAAGGGARARRHGVRLAHRQGALHVARQLARCTHTYINFELTTSVSLLPPFLPFDSFFNLKLLPIVIGFRSTTTRSNFVSLLGATRTSTTIELSRIEIS